MKTVSAFTTGNYPCQPVAVYLSIKLLNLSFMLEFKSDVIKDFVSGKMLHTFAAVEILMKNAFFAFSPFLYVLMGS